MTGFIVFIHAVACIILVIVVLMQSGRGGGLTEGFAAAESMFGAKTNAFMVKTTTVFAVVFFVTSVGLAFLSSKKQQSLMSGVTASQSDDVRLPAASTELPAGEESVSSESAFGEPVSPGDEQAVQEEALPLPAP